MACIALACLALPATAGAAKGDPLRTAVIDHGELDGPDAEAALRRARDAGLTAYRVMLAWYKVAPLERPDGFNPADPADSAYRWEAFDLKIRRLRAFGMEPVVTVNYPPAWAGGGHRPSPDPVEVGRFMRAVGERYSGRFGGLPRVRYWHIWNEANVNLFFGPQFDATGKFVAPDLYRRVLNEAATSLKAVHQDNIVIAGGLSPFVLHDGETHIESPLRFMRQFLCMSDGRPPVATCNERVAFDVWAAHPYTKGGPTTRSASPEESSIGDLPQMMALVQAAARAGHVATNQKLGLFVTEFSWDTSPPDPEGVPMRLHVRWVAEALYRMWQAGVSLVTWLQLRDEPRPQPTQGGLYFRGGGRLGCDRAKLSASAYSFPFVAFRTKSAARVWGRTPAGRSGRVAIEQLQGKKWKSIATLATDRNGIFEKTLKLRSPGKRGTFSVNGSYTRSYRTLVFCDDPTSYWRLGEASGSAALDEMGVQQGTYDGGSSRAVAGALRSDAANRAVSLDGTAGKLALGPVAYPRTVELWLKTTSTADVAAFSNRDEFSRHVFLGVQGGKARVFDSVGLSGTKTINDNQWHHLVYTYEGTTGKLYVDGALEASAAWERVEGGAPAYVGYDTTLRAFFPGSVDELAVYPHALTAAQVRNHYLGSQRLLKLGGVDRFSGSYLRARLVKGSRASFPFSLVRVPDRRIEDPFGS